MTQDPNNLSHLDPKTYPHFELRMLDMEHWLVLVYERVLYLYDGKMHQVWQFRYSYAF